MAGTNRVEILDANRDQNAKTEKEEIENDRSVNTCSNLACTFC